MKILMVDKYYFVKGGAERYLFELTEVLQANGHAVIPFSMKHAQNFPTPFDAYFVENMDYALVSAWQKLAHAARIAGRMIYSTQARQRLELLLERERPDVAHLHMIDHQLSPSILLALKKYRVPVIMTVHQYKLICPNYRLYNPRTGAICEKCLSGNFYHPIVERCHKDSAAAGLLLALESYLHRWTKIYERNVDLFHVPSEFMGRKLRQAGVAGGKIRFLPYTIKMDKFEPCYTNRNYVLYFGRLSDEKGILTLLRASAKLPHIPLSIVGDGPEDARMQQFARDHQMRQVSFLGRKSGAELARLVQNANFVVVPSEWYDNSPLVIYESFAYGKPVISTRLGGMPEWVKDHETGLLFDARDPDQLAERIKFLWEHPERVVAFGRNARAMAEEKFQPAAHYEIVHDWYRRLVGGAPVPERTAAPGKPDAVERLLAT